MTNPIKRMIINHRKLKTPSCSTCAKCIETISGIRCKAPKYCDRKNRLNCTNITTALFENVRGTRFCEYEEREDGERQDD